MITQLHSPKKGDGREGGGLHRFICQHIRGYSSKGFLKVLSLIKLVPTSIYVLLGEVTGLSAGFGDRWTGERL